MLRVLWMSRRRLKKYVCHNWPTHRGSWISHQNVEHQLKAPNPLPTDHTSCSHSPKCLHPETLWESWCLLVRPESGKSSKHVTSWIGEHLSPQTRKYPKGYQLRGGGFKPPVGQELCIPFHKTNKESRKPLEELCKLNLKLHYAFPPDNTVTVESYYMCVSEDFKMEINIFPKSAVIIKMRICLTVRNSEFKKFLFLKLNADESYTVQNRNIFFS